MRRAGLAAGVGLAVAGAAQAQVVEWVNPAGGDWADASNWSTGAWPPPNGILRFGLDSAYTVLGPAYYEGRRLTIDRSDLTMRRRTEQTAGTGAFFDESEPINPPAVLIGSIPGARASLTTDLPMGGRRTVVGAAGEASLISTTTWWAEELFLGGAAENASAVGRFTLNGPDAELLYGVDDLPDVTVGLAGTGVFTAIGGASSQIDLLRLAVEAGSSAEVRISGQGTRIDVGLVEIGDGDASLVVEHGGTLALPEDSTLGDVRDQSTLRLTIDGGTVEGVSAFQLRPESELRLTGGSDIRLTELSPTALGSLEIRGSASQLDAGGILVRGPLILHDGATLSIRPGVGQFPSTALFEGGVTIDGASLVADDGLDLGAPGRFLGVGLAGSALGDDRRTRIVRGATVSVEGLLTIAFERDSEIRGPGTVVHQRVQRIQSMIPPGQVLEGGALRVSGIGDSPSTRPRMEIGDGATVEGSSIIIVADVRMGAGVLRAAEFLGVQYYGSLHVSDAGVVESPQLVLGTPGSGQTPPVAIDRMAGDGVVRSVVVNGGVIDPGAREIVGALRIDGALTQRLVFVTLPESLPNTQDGWVHPGILHIDIASPTNHDRLEVTGDALLGGTLEVTLLDGFAPAWGDAFTVLTAGAVGGAFETLDLPEAPSGFVYEVAYTDTTATLSLQRRTDITRDLVVSAEDLGALLQHWGTADARADVNGDGVVDGADLGVLLGDWGASAR